MNSFVEPGHIDPLAQDPRLAGQEPLEQANIFRIAALSAGVAPWYLDAETGRFWASDSLYEMLGFAPDDVDLSSTWIRSRIHQDDLQSAIDRVEALISGDSDRYIADYRIRRKDGSWLWIKSIGLRLPRDQPGKLPVICGSMSSIEHLKENERRLNEAAATAEAARAEAQASEDMLRASASCGDIGPWNVCPETGDCWMMDVTYRMFGYEPGEFVPDDKGWKNLIHPDDLDAANAKMGNLVMGRSDVYDAEHRIRHKDGSYHWYRGIARKIDRSAQGLPFLIAGTTTRIEHLKENERRLAEAAATSKRISERLNTLADNAPGALFEYRRDPDGAIDFPYFSAKLPDLLGIECAALETDGAAVFANIHPEDVERVIQEIDESRERLSPLELHFRINHPVRGLRWLMVSSLPFEQHDGAVIWFGNLFDNTERREIEERAIEASREVQEAHARLTTIADNAPAGIFEFRRYPNGDGDFPYTSAHFEALVGYSRAEIEALGLETFKRVHVEDWPEMYASMEESANTLHQWSHRFRLDHPTRGVLWVAGSSTPTLHEDGTIVWAGVIYDVTKDVLREAELRHAHELAEQMRAENERQALEDVLTGLPNRRSFDQVLAERRAAAETAPRDCVLVRIDIDRFKYVNDTLGHEAGDAVLRRFGDIIRANCRADDIGARIGGDEFSIVLAPGSDTDTAKGIIGRIQNALNEPLLYKGRKCTIRASFGIAHVEDLNEVGLEIQSFADVALYRAKEKGRNRMEFFTPTLHQDILNDRRLAREIHDALTNNEFVPFFQPQVSAIDGSLSGIETLVRWNHPTRGVLAPGSFLGVAEQLRVVPEIDRIMLEKSHLILERWQEEGIVIPKISFNVSSGRMKDPAIVSCAKDIARLETRVAFELLESILVEEESEVFRFHLDSIVDAGIDIEIDDFGSGHASIIGLMQISPSALKIDRRIVAPVASNERSRNLVRAIIEIAETLGIGTIAEGVETPQQARILKEVGCDTLQGFLFAKPLSENDLKDFVRRFGSREVFQFGSNG